jgi:NAD(P)H dehydrogenase (quinone)
LRSTSSTGEKTAMSEPVRILVAYYSRRGSTQRLAEEVAAGARDIPGTLVLLKRIEEVVAADLLQADGLAVGSPVYFGTMAAAVKTFFEDWQFRFDFYPSRPMRDKVGAVFATGGQGAGGRELAMLGMLAAMLHQWMIVLSGESPIGASAATETKPVPVDQHELAEARALGRRLAEVAATVRRGRTAGLEQRHER